VVWGWCLRLLRRLLRRQILFLGRWDRCMAVRFLRRREREFMLTCPSGDSLLRVVPGHTTVYPPISLPELITVHQYPVTGNNCSTAGPPFALSNETNIPAPCPPADSPNGCRAGDMAGQFGNLTVTGTTVTASYYDPYISLDPTHPNYIGNLSFNVHWANFTVIACCK
jgi:hypothetical protein